MRRFRAPKKRTTQNIRQIRKEIRPLLISVLGLSHYSIVKIENQEDYFNILTVN